MNKLSVVIALSFLLTACQKTSVEEPVTTASKAQTTVSVEKVSLEDTFWNTLSQQCGTIYKGESSFPDNPEDSFYGKTLIADFANCSATEIRVPFSVGENKSRTWIFTKLDNGKLQLKHQHLHDDGTADKVSNYGGVSDGGDIEINGGLKMTHIHFPADAFTKQLLPEASTNVWTIELIASEDPSKNAMSYNLYRNSKKRFIAKLNKTTEN